MKRPDPLGPKSKRHDYRMMSRMVSLYVFVIIGLPLLAQAAAPHWWVRATVRYSSVISFFSVPMNRFHQPGLLSFQ